jgi:uncharacterized Zn finger protein (UPF0148 family)
MTSDDETRVMSRALTRGATMLDDACDDCGNPLFRYQGEVFCPVCQERHDRQGDTEKESERGRAEENGNEDVKNRSASPREEEKERDGTEELREVDESLRTLARRLARDAAERSEDPDAVERRLDALERTLNLLR